MSLSVVHFIVYLTLSVVHFIFICCAGALYLFHCGIGRNIVSISLYV